MLISNNESKAPIRIEVCGGIASGKTTFTRLLNDAGVDAVFEDFQANPFWELFYCDPDKYAFETEITFLLQHYNDIKVRSEHSQTLICDFSLYLDLAYASVTLQETKHQAFQAVFNEIQHDLIQPDLLVYLRCSADVELQRIRSRARRAEQLINIEFLETVNKALEQHVGELGSDSRVITIDSEKWNFATDEKVREEIATSILDSFRSTRIIKEFM